MKHHLTTLSIATVAVIVISIVLLQYNEYRFGQNDTTPFLANLVENLDNVSSFEITRAKNTVIIERVGSDWEVAGKPGYSVDTNRVRELLLGLKQLKILEEKTSNPERYSALGVEEPAANNNAMRVTLYSGTGTSLADIVIGGMRKTINDGVVQGAFYARKFDDTQAYLLQGDVNVEDNEKYWLNRALLRLNPQLVNALTLTHPKSKNNVHIGRTQDEQGNKNFVLTNLPKGKDISAQMDIDAIASVVSNMDYWEVFKKEDKRAELKNPVIAVYKLDGNITVSLNVWEEKLSKKEQEAQQKTSRFYVSIGIEKPNAELPPQFEAAIKRVESYAPWIYEIGGYQGALLTKTLSQLVK